MRYIFLILIPFLLMAENIDTLYERVLKSNLYKSKSEALNSNLQATKSSLYSDGWSVGANLGQSQGRNGAESGLEYGISLNKDFKLNGSSVDALIKTTQLYIDNSKKIEENRLKTKLWRLYGNYCITEEALQARGELASVYDTISKHIDKGVEYGEFDISKSIMANLALQNMNLQISKLENITQGYELEIKKIVPFNGQFICKRLRPNIENLFKPEYSALRPMLERQVEINKDKLSIVSTKIPKVNIDASYSNEIDTDKYMINISVPLAFGEKNQAQRASAMSALNASNYELETFRNNYIHESNVMERQLNIYKKYLKASDKLIRESSDKLIQHSNMRFRAGEESLISMLKATETKVQMIEAILELKIDRHNAVAQYMYNYAIDPKGVSK
ncbi:MAG: TolC family protein [Sulfurimonas sp.]|nr:TolC family protein [Sulfurimonas sp.]